MLSNHNSPVSEPRILDGLRKMALTYLSSLLVLLVFLQIVSLSVHNIFLLHI